jgi:hypothetical protein
MLGVAVSWYFYVHIFSSARIAEEATDVQTLPRTRLSTSLSLEEQEAIIREDHRFIKVLKKRVEGHELALRKQDELNVQEREDFRKLIADLGQLLNQYMHHSTLHTASILIAAYTCTCSPRYPSYAYACSSGW